ncbi:MAG: exodeoxyribonuclease III [Candidatus Falkowbacteria bacterium]|nr:exodeoxyribonuclease III [Candidatus Falkowbacteria bacterium]
MKIISWNINGIRAIAKKGLSNFLIKEKPDVLCLQETKISDTKREEHKFSAPGGPASGWDFSGYQEYWHSAKRPGYSGVLTLVKNGIKILNYSNELGDKMFDNEGRVNILELKDFYLLNVYFPNANHELTRLDYKLEFSHELQTYIKKLEKNLSAGKAVKPVIVAGDYNVAHEEIDLARPKDNIGNAGFTYEEREWMTKFLKSGFIDTFRYKNPNKIQYSWWGYRFNLRERNIGWRVDYICVAEKLAPQVEKAFIMNNVFGSDHCPVGMEISF